MEPSFPTIAAPLPLDWASADPEQGLTQIEQAQELIYALRLERIVERLSRGWPASLKSILVKRKAMGTGWDVKLPRSTSSGDEEGYEDSFLVTSTLAVDLVEANLPSDWVTKVFYLQRGAVGPSFVSLEVIQEQARQTIAERVGPLRALLNLDQNLSEASPSVRKPPRF